MRLATFLALVLASSASSVVFAGHVDRRQIARYGNMDLVATVTPEGGGRATVSVGFALSDRALTVLERKAVPGDGVDALVSSIAVQQCRSDQAGRFVLRVSASEMHSVFYAIDQTKKSYGEYPATMANCPTSLVPPVAWHALPNAR